MADLLQQIGWDTSRALVETLPISREPRLNEELIEIVMYDELVSNVWHWPSEERLSTYENSPSILRLSLPVDGNIKSGAQLIGVNGDNFTTLTGNTNLQNVLDDIDIKVGVTSESILKNGTVNMDEYWQTEKGISVNDLNSSYSKDVHALQVVDGEILNVNGEFPASEILSNGNFNSGDPPIDWIISGVTSSWFGSVGAFSFKIDGDNGFTGYLQQDVVEMVINADDIISNTPMILSYDVSNFVGDISVQVTGCIVPTYLPIINGTQKVIVWGVLDINISLPANNNIKFSYNIGADNSVVNIDNISLKPIIGSTLYTGNIRTSGNINGALKLDIHNEGVTQFPDFTLGINLTNGFIDKKPATVTTTTATPAIIDTLLLETNHSYFIEVEVMGANRTDTQLYTYKAIHRAYRIGAGAVLFGVITKYVDNDGGTLADINLIVNVNNIDLQVTGIATKNILWMCKFRYFDIDDSP